MSVEGTPQDPCPDRSEELLHKANELIATTQELAEEGDQLRRQELALAAYRATTTRMAVTGEIVCRMLPRLGAARDASSTTAVRLPEGIRTAQVETLKTLLASLSAIALDSAEGPFLGDEDLLLDDREQQVDLDPGEDDDDDDQDPPPDPDLRGLGRRP